jgi:hypothetical protein
MSKEDKELLLKDLYARISYKLYTNVRDPEEKDAFQPFEVLGVKGDMIWVRNKLLHIDHFDAVEVVKPYLRPMSSMTEEEKEEFENLLEGIVDGIERWDKPDLCEEYDWLNAHQFDYRGLIEKRLALEAPEGMYDIK